MPTKEYILSQLKAMAVDGKAPGRDSFANATGIKWNDIKKHWARWGDAVRDAELDANEFGKQKYSEDDLCKMLADYAEELAHFPTQPEINLRSRISRDIPNESVFEDRLGRVRARKIKVLEYCKSHTGYEDVAIMIEKSLPKVPRMGEEADVPSIAGAVYLMRMKMGKSYVYKIGLSKDAGQRRRQLEIQLPEKPETIHSIETNAPGELEAHWHNRFKDKRKNGEWFNLDSEDIKVFKRYKKAIRRWDWN